MKTNAIATLITKPRILGPAVFIGVGLVKTVHDYRKEKPERKKRVLLKDGAILAGSVAGFALVSPLTRLLCRTKFAEMFLKNVKKFVSSSAEKSFQPHSKASLGLQKLLKNTEHVLKESIAGTINTFAGIVGAIYSNEFMHKYVLSKPKVTDQSTKQSEPAKHGKSIDVKSKGYFQESKVFNNFNYIDKSLAKDAANSMFSTLSDMPNMRVLEKPMIALAGFSVANTKGYHNKFKKTSYELLANTLIPTIFVSAMTLAVEKKEPMKKYPALFAALTLGALVGAKVANKYKEKINETIDGIDMKHIVV